ncbi:MAG: hypothetical protein R2880_04125 [Deinococcales bacterium]
MLQVCLRLLLLFSICLLGMNLSNPVLANHDGQSVQSTTPSIVLPSTSSPTVSTSYLPQEELPPEPVVTWHQLELPQSSINYRATVGFLPIESNAVTFANIFYVSYVKDDSHQLGVVPQSSLQVLPSSPINQPRVIFPDTPSPQGISLLPANSQDPPVTWSERDPSLNGLSIKPLELNSSHLNDQTEINTPQAQNSDRVESDHGNHHANDANNSVPDAGDEAKSGDEAKAVAEDEMTEHQAESQARLSDAKKPSERPITFVFNGGPGSSSVILHMFALGPKRALLADDGRSLPPPPEIVDNIYSWLEFTDLVFIDPVGTGFSDAMNPFPFYDVMNDAASVAEFVRRYLTENNRWLSPVFVVGESYGGIRGALLSWRLMNDNNIALRLSGLLLISPALDLDVTFPDAYKNLQLSLFVPTMAATAWYHGRLEPSLLTDRAALLAEVEAWSQAVYLPALIKGNRLSAEEMEEVATTMSRYSGLSLEYILDKRLRVMPEEYFAEFLRDKRQTLSRNDSRFDENDVAASATILSPVWNYYVREELNYQGKEAYTLFSPEARLFWTWGDGEMAFSVLPILSEVMAQNPHMKLFVASGYYDFTVPYYVIDYTLRQLQISSEEANNITHISYDSGHAVYTSKAELIQFTQDVKHFFENTLKR